MVMDDSHFSAKVFLPGVVQHSLGITTAAQSHDISWLQFQREVEVVDGTYRDSGRCWVLTKGWWKLKVYTVVIPRNPQTNSEKRIFTILMGIYFSVLEDD